MRTRVSGMFLSALLMASTAMADGDAAKGKESYAKLCAGCHGAAGKGDGAAAVALDPKPRDLTNKVEMAKLNDMYLMDIITKGGAAVGKSPMMPPWGAQLKEPDVKNVIAYIRLLAK